MSKFSTLEGEHVRQNLLYQKIISILKKHHEKRSQNEI